MVAQIGEQLGPGLDEVDVVAVTFLGFVALGPRVRLFRRDAVVDQAAMLALEELELPVDQIAEARASQSHTI